MKLYIWNNPYGVSYGGSCAYAVGSTEQEARELVSVAPINLYGGGAEQITRPPMDIGGPPDAVHELPYAEIYEWSE